MAISSQTDSSAHPRPGVADDNLEHELERAERRLRYEREHRVFGEHPNGVGQTLGGDLGQPNPGHDIDWNDERYDPPT